MTVRDKAKDMAERVRQAPENTVGTITAQVKLKFLDRWMERTRKLGRPCEDPSQIAYDDYQIHVESLLCDPANIIRLQSKRLRKSFLAELTEEERRYLLESNPQAYEDFQKHKLKTALKNLKK